MKSNSSTLDSLAQHISLLQRKQTSSWFFSFFLFSPLHVFALCQQSFQAAPQYFSHGEEGGPVLLPCIV